MVERRACGELLGDRILMRYRQETSDRRQQQWGNREEMEPQHLGHALILFPLTQILLSF